MNVTCCSDGILCLVYKDIILLWNPRINEYKRVPLPDNFCQKAAVLGFGYDSSIDDFKVLKLPVLRYPFPSADVELLTLKSNAWKKLADDFANAVPPHHLPVSLDGAFVLVCFRC